MAATVHPLSRRRHGLMPRVLAYAASRGATEALLGIRGLALAALLGPAAFGGWALLRLTMRYASLGSFGVFRGLELELLRKHAEAGPAASAASTALGFILAVAGMVALVAAGASAVIADPQHALFLRGFAAGLLAEQVYLYAMVCTRVRHDLRRYALLENAHAVLQLVCVLAFAAAWGLAGAYAGLALASLLGFALAARGIELRPSLRLAPLRRLLRVGMPLGLNLILAMALATADRWVVAAFGGRAMLGYYALAAQVAGLAVTFAWVIRTVIFPNVYRDAQDDPAPAVRAHLERVVLPFARLFPPLLGGLSCIVGPVVALLLPSYVEAIPAVRIFLLTGAAVGLVSLASIGVVAAGQHHRLPAFSAAALAVNLTLSFLALRAGAGLALVAAASFTGQLLFAGCVLDLVARASGIANRRRFLTRTLIPLGWCVVLVAGLGQLLPGTDPAPAVLALLLYVVLLAPLVPGMQRGWRRVVGRTV